jgi:hypothetical protein
MKSHDLRAALLTPLLLAIACSDISPPTDPWSIDAASRLRSNNSGVVPVGSNAFGRSYGEWSAAWWQWAYSIPVPSNPLFDETGALCSSGQSGKVWFLAGVFNASGTAVRNDCAIPTGKALFVPILNGECSNVEGNGSTAAEWRACAAAQMDLAADVSAEIDGTPIHDVAQYRVQSPRPFGLRLPDNNILQLFGFNAPEGRCFPTPAGCTPYRSVADGYYLLLRPLSAGAHTLHVHGAIPAFGFTLDVTYHLQVRHRPGSDPD